MKEQIAQEIKLAMKSGKIGISLDLWSDKFRNIDYLGAIAHYIKYDEEQKKPYLVGRLLKIKAMDADEEKTAMVIHEHTVSILNEFDIQDDVDRIVYVSDRGKNIVNSCDGYARNSCLDHFINNIVCKMVKEIESIRVRVTKVNKTIDQQLLAKFSQYSISS